MTEPTEPLRGKGKRSDPAPPFEQAILWRLQQ